MSNNILKFSMNRFTSVEKIADDRLLSICRLRDYVTDAEVRIEVQMPDLAIKSAKGRFRHDRLDEIDDIEHVLEKLINVRVGAGMLKIIEGLFGDAENLKQLTYMAEECCHGVILSLTRKVLLKSPDDEPGKVDFYSKMVEKNIRLYDRCAAFAAGTRLVKGYESQHCS